MNYDYEISTVCFETAKLLVERTEALYLPHNFMDHILRSNKNFNKNFRKLSERAALKISQGFGKRHSKKTKLEDATLSQAVWFLYWTELCNLIPVRTVIKHLKEELNGKLVLVPMISHEITIFEEWKSYSEILSLMIYSELKKFNINACLVMPPNHPKSQITIKINDNFINSQIITRDGIIFCPKGVRGSNIILKNLYSDFGSKENLKSFLLSLKSSPIKNTIIKLRSSNEQTDGIEFLKYKSDHPLSHYVEVTQTEFLEKLRLVYDNICNMISHMQSGEANICAHLFVDTALIAGAVRSKGGRVTLWPHSCRDSLKEHRIAIPEKIVRVCSDSEIDKCAFRSTKFTIQSELMFSEPKNVLCVEKNEKQNIIIIAGAPKLNQLPLVDALKHEALIKELFDGLWERQDFLNVFFRTKRNWCDLTYFEQIINKPLNEAPLGPTEINLPNMTFVSIELSSAALIEGVGRGIPSIIVGDGQNTDHRVFEEAFFPTVGVNETLQLIDHFRDRGKYERYWKEQSIWFKKTAHFN